MTGYKRAGEHVTPQQLRTLELLRAAGHATADEIAAALSRTRAQTERTLELLADKGLAVLDRAEGEVGLRWRCAQRGEVRSITLAREVAGRTARLKPGEGERLELRCQWLARLDSLLIGDSVWPIERAQRFVAPVYCDRAIQLTRDSRTPDDLHARPGDLLLVSVPAPPASELAPTTLVLAEEVGIERLMLRTLAERGGLHVTAWVQGLWRSFL